MQSETRAEVESRWLELTRVELPSIARGRGWPVWQDHCLQRILLDAACEGVWYDHIPRRPAYAHADTAVLERAVRLGEAALAGEADVAALNRQSLAWRREPGRASRR